MKNLFVLLAVLALLLVVVAVMTGANKKRGGKGEKPKQKALMTEREQAMYNRLVQALPELVVLAQVSFSALLTARSYAARNTFDRKVADFVVCDKAFRVLAVVELDDSSHRGREKEDGARDVLLVNAGYRVLRYPRVPDIDRVRDDFESPAVPTMPAELMDMRAER
ncbi:DUF2726 domain-containing protein [Acidovorax sp. sif1233]|uniref:DUF2726 domain-containing protein n=1 Tax=Acidovorax sp. sif1233 TaxID=2854792 RepID=UPI001C486AF2|nr:DUF2726 domain-containing protein [Acidovorax sp. sif1233]MBV7453397.1 DUF2726 domain-containing protein [Acidovorax sp. sif1233]